MGRWLLLALLVLGLLAFYFVPPFRSKATQVLMLFTAANAQSMAGFIRSCGAFAAPVSVFLMLVQAVVAPLSMQTVVFANAAIFGWWQGALLSWAGSLVGAAACFGIARVLCRSLVERLAKRGPIQTVDSFFEQHGTLAVFACNLFPFIPFDAVSYFTGITSIKFKDFLLGTALGQLPAIVVCSFVGKTLVGDAKTIYTVVLSVIALVVLIVALRKKS